MDYNERTQEFLDRIGAKVTMTYLGVVPTPRTWGGNNDMLHRKYRVTISRNGEKMTLYFHGSYKDFIDCKDPTPYDVLSCIEKYEPASSVKEFADEFGYDIYEDTSRTIEAYEGVCKEWEGVYRIFGDVLDELREITQ